MAQFDKQKCAARNRLAARRDGVNAAPVTLLRFDGEDQWQFARAAKLPTSEADCLAAINALLPEGAEPLTSEQVYIHFCEAANTNFVGDRYLFLDRSTLKNIARNAGEGVAFMNSHRTGGMSHPSEQPFGKTFAGRYEEDERGARSVVGVYMLRGVQPNGKDGPSTDDLDAQIRGGVLADVSVGLYGGEAVCDVCGQDLNAQDSRGEWLCPHVPGTDWELTEAQKKAQKARGVPDGKCSYSLVNARMGEVSGVYDGAVPGAGFRKALSLRKQMDGERLTQCREAYCALARGSEFAQAEGDGTASNGAVFVGEITDPYAFRYFDADGNEISVASTITFTNTNDLDGADAAPSFEEQLTQAILAFEGCIERAEGYAKVSAGRLAQLAALTERSTRLRERLTRPDRLRGLRQKALALRAAGLSLPLGS